MKNERWFFLLPCSLWIGLFVVLPLLMTFWTSLTGNGSISLENFSNFFTNTTFLRMTLNSFWYVLLTTLFTLLVSYPVAYILTKLKNQQFWLLLIILPIWINLLLKAYVFIGIFGRDGLVNSFLYLFGIGPVSILFTNFAFILVVTYIEIPLMILPIYTAIKEVDPALINAANNLGVSKWQTFRYIIWPLSLPGVESGVRATFIPSLSLFMLTRLIGDNRVIILGTAIEEYFTTTMNWSMGSTIGVILIVMTVAVMVMTGKENKRKKEVKL